MERIIPCHIDVTKDNFEEVYDQFAEEILQSVFIGVDGEFSGISVSKAHEVNYCDCENLRYEKLKISVKNFELLQFGVCLFLRGGDTDDSNIIIPRAYNFHIFKNVDRTCHTFSNATFRFLRANNMDFHKFVEKGLPYLNEIEENELRKYQQQKVDALYDSIGQSSSDESVGKIPKSNYTAEDHLYVSTIHAQLVNWYQNQTDSPVLEIRPKSSYHRKLIFDNFLHHEDFPKGTIYISSENDEQGWKYLKVWRLEQKEGDNPTKSIEEKNEKVIEEKLGFSRIVKLLTRVQCPIVGHYCILDFLHLLHKCVMPLPDTVFEMKNLLKRTFPMNIVDTKILASKRQELRDFAGRNTSLKALFDHCLSQHFYERKNLDEDESNKVPEILTLKVGDHIGAHVASYDAYMTGVVFALLTSKSHEMTFPLTKSFTNYGDTQHLAGTVNVMYMMRWPHPLYLTTDPENIPTYVKLEQSFQHGRRRIFLLSNLNNQVKQNEIMQVFARFGTRNQICWINDRLAFLKISSSSSYGKKGGDIVDPQVVIDSTRNPRFIVSTYEEALRNGILLSALYEGVCGNNCRKRLTPCTYDSYLGGNDNNSVKEESEKKRSRFCVVM